MCLPVNPSKIITTQQAAKVVPRSQTLFERMCYLAEDILLHNWTDVAVHDRRILDNTKPGEFRLWIVTEVGTLFPPMFCRLHQEYRSHASGCLRMSAVEVHLMRLAGSPAGGMLSQKFYDSIKNTPKKFFLIGKGVDDWSGSIEPIGLSDIMDFAFPA